MIVDLSHPDLYGLHLDDVLLSGLPTTVKVKFCPTY